MVLSVMSSELNMPLRYSEQSDDIIMYKVHRISIIEVLLDIMLASKLGKFSFLGVLRVFRGCLRRQGIRRSGLPLHPCSVCIRITTHICIHLTGGKIT